MFKREQMNFPVLRWFMSTWCLIYGHIKTGKIHSILKVFNWSVADLLSKAPVRIATQEHVENSLKFKKYSETVDFFLFLSAIVANWEEKCTSSHLNCTRIEALFFQLLHCMISVEISSLFRNNTPEAVL